MTEYESYDSLLSSTGNKPNRKRNYVCRHLQFPRQTYDLYKENFYQEFPFSKIKGKENPYTRTKIETWHDYELYGHCYVLKQRAEECFFEKDEQREKRIQQLETDLKITEHELSDAKHQSKKNFLLFVVACFFALIFLICFLSRPTNNNYRALLSEISVLEEQNKELTSSILDAEEEIAKQKHLLSEARSESASNSSSTASSFSNDNQTPSTPSSSGYIGNAKTKKFHKPSCSYLPDKSNQVNLKSRTDATSKGYSPCGHCNP